jgi:hypothetical protein
MRMTLAAACSFAVEAVLASFLAIKVSSVYPE